MNASPPSLPVLYPVRFIFMGSDPIALPALEALWHSQSDKQTQFAGIFTQPDRPKGRGQQTVANEIKQWGLSKGIPVFQPTTIGDPEAEWLREQDVRMAWVMAYGHLLKQAFLDALPLGAWNLHASLLPKYRGAAPIEAALMAGDPCTGVTLMRMVRKMDAGPMVAQEAFVIPADMDQPAARTAMAQAAATLVGKYHRLLCLDPQQVPLMMQEEQEATYVGKLSKEDGRLDFCRSAVTLERRVRALCAWPGCTFQYGELTLRVGGAQVVPVWEGYLPEEPGTVLGMREQALCVAVGQGTVIGFTRLQKPFGKMLPAAAFVHGFPMPPGTRLG